MARDPSCIIVGSGMAGLTAARFLQQRHWRVVVLDKGRNSGGRMATRSSEGHCFDHGAQFFTARDPEFRQTIEIWLRNRWACPWFTAGSSEGGLVRYRGTEGMSALAGHMTAGLDVRQNITVLGVTPGGAGWTVVTSTGAVFESNAVILTSPVPQALDILKGSEEWLDEELRRELESVVYEPCFALMVTLDAPSKVAEPGFLRLDNGPIAVISDNTKKGLASGPADVTIHSTSSFAQEYADEPDAAVTTRLLETANPYLGSPPLSSQLHRWRYSKPSVLYPQPCLSLRKPAPIAFAGDGFGGTRIEGAYVSGLRAAREIDNG
jgi:renalase